MLKDEASKNAQKPASGKKAYKEPSLKDYGNLVALTKVATGNNKETHPVKPGSKIT